MMNNKWHKVGDYDVSNQLLGKGKFSEVYYAVNSKTNEKIAAKRIPIKDMSQQFFDRLKNQIKILTTLSSPFIVKLHGYSKVLDENQQPIYFYIFLEYCGEADLGVYIASRQEKKLSEAEAILFLRHIIQGYKKLHSNNILHRDIKPGNIMLKNGIAKLSDFGFSRQVDDPQKPKTYSFVGTLFYAAPQILNQLQFSSKCDVWSLGIVLFQMLYGRIPWFGGKPLEVLKSIYKNPIQQFQLNRSPQINQLLKGMLKIQQKKRLSWSEIFAHPLFKQQISIKQVNHGIISYQQFLESFMKYIESNAVILFHLRNNIKFSNEYKNIDNSCSQNAMQKQQNIQIVLQMQKYNLKKCKAISKIIIHKRNLTFFYAYILYLYYKNKKILPSTVNSGMELQYALANKALNMIAEIGNEILKQNSSLFSKQQWGMFRTSSDYLYISKLIESDYKLLYQLTDIITTKIKQLSKSQQIGQQIKNIMKNKNKQDMFQKILTTNITNITKKSKQGIYKLMSYYLDMALNPQYLDNQSFEFSYFYENQQKQYLVS